MIGLPKKVLVLDFNTCHLHSALNVLSPTLVEDEDVLAIGRFLKGSDSVLAVVSQCVSPLAVRLVRF